MTDHADFVSFSAASRTACRCGVSCGQGLRVSASREGERRGSTAWLPAEGPALPPLPTQQRAQGEPEQGRSSGGNGGCESCPRGRAKPLTPQHTCAHVGYIWTCGHGCPRPLSLAGCQCVLPTLGPGRSLPEVLLSLFKQLSGCFLACTAKAWDQEVFLPTLAVD